MIYNLSLHQQMLFILAHEFKYVKKKQNGLAYCRSICDHVNNREQKLS